MIDDPAECRKIRREGYFNLLDYCRDKISESETKRWQKDCDVTVTVIETAANFVCDEIGETIIENLGKPESSDHWPSGKTESTAQLTLETLLLVVDLALERGISGGGRWLRAGLASARLLNRPRDEVTFFQTLGTAYFNRGEYALADAYYRQALSAPDDVVNKNDRGMLLSNLGQAYAYQGQYDVAIARYEEALLIAREIGDKRIEGSCMGGLGWAYGDRGEYLRALEYYQQGVKFARETSDKLSEGVRLGAIGALHWQLGYGDKAITDIEQAIRIANEINDERRKGTRQYGLGTIHRHLGDYDKAIDFLKESLKIAEKIDDRRGLGVRQGPLGECYADKGEFAEALRWQNQGLTILTKLNLIKYKVYAEIGLGETYLLMSRFDDALAQLFKGLQLANQVSNPAAQLTAEAALARVHLHTRRLPEALKHITATRKYDVPLHKHCAAAFHGVILLRSEQRNAAQTAFEDALRYAEELLMKTPQMYRAKYSRGLTFCGLALLSTSQERAALIEEAKVSYRSALANCAVRGIVDDSLCLLNELVPLDTQGVLTSVQTILYAGLSQEQSISKSL